MFQKGIFPKNLFTYIGENHILLEIITVGVMLLFFLAILIQISKMKKEIRRICRQVRRYLDVVLSESVEDLDEETEEETEETPEEMADIQEIHTYQRKKEQTTSKRNQSREEELKQSQKDAQLLMDVISDVF